jgi:hypothetical protein
VVEPREVARVAVVWAWTIGGKDGFDPGAGYATTAAEGNEIRSSDGRVDWMRPQTPTKLAAKLLAVPVMPSHVGRVREGETMSNRIPLFVELCAGLAAVSLGLEGGKYARPPVSRMGSKVGYLLPLLRIMGLRPGQGADRYLWCEPDPGCRALLHAYTDREVMQEAARIIRSWKDEEPRALWERLRAEGPIWVGEAREVARWGYLAGSAYIQGDPSTAYAGDPGSNGGRMGDVRVRFAGRADRAPTLPATVTPDARPIEPADLPPGTVVFMDPPYVGTTGYGNDLPREDVVMLARRWRDAGARVYISEAEPLPSLVADGWHAVEITSQRSGQKRTFSKQQREWVTCSHPPAWRPAEQRGLFPRPALPV